MENTSSWSVWKVKAGFDLNYSRYKSNEYRKVFANALREYDYHTDLSLWRWGMFASVDMLLPTKVLQLPWAYVPTEIIIAIK